MKIRIVLKYRDFERGEEIDLPEAEALALVYDGIAVDARAVEVQPPPPPSSDKKKGRG